MKIALINEYDRVYAMRSENPLCYLDYRDMILDGEFLSKDYFFTEDYNKAKVCRSRREIIGFIKNKFKNVQIIDL